MNPVYGNDYITGNKLFKGGYHFSGEIIEERSSKPNITGNELSKTGLKRSDRPGRFIAKDSKRSGSTIHKSESQRQARNAVAPATIKVTEFESGWVHPIDDKGWKEMEDRESKDKGVRETNETGCCVQCMGMAAAFVLPIAVILLILACSTPYWFIRNNDNLGLFQYCVNWTRTCYSLGNRLKNETETAQLAFTLTPPLLASGTALSLVSVFLFCCFPCHGTLNGTKLCCGVIIAVIILFGTILVSVGVSVMWYFYLTDNSKFYASWSLFLGTGGASISILAAIFFWTHVIYSACLDRH
ncbi:hypothetical protein CHS0354_026877 [Potamilus streckersoni]|uniref:Uncharacterized protein n=1 Tax=Potamilus streckersoni TaxID=2493646 RepID=A0AAE0SPH8_9BIVA|nr:hypothetical protein CHS0354_026877 [Potamilus streckersoni]